MPKYKFIIYSLFLTVVPVSVSADSSTTAMPAATVGMLSSPTSPSVGHRPEKKLDRYQLTKDGGYYFSDLEYNPFPGLTMTRASIYKSSDPDNKYQATETFTTVCTFYQVNKDGSQHVLKHEKPCEYKFNIKKEHVGSKIKLEVYNETDISSASGYTPVPLLSEFHYVETKTISNTPSQDLTVINVDNAVLSVGESATITTLVKDIDGNPINDAEIRPYWGMENSKSEWFRGPVKKGVSPGEYTQTITYLGGYRGRLDVTYRYHGDVFSKRISIQGKL
ncbi:TPA: hypothetical protein N2G30_000018 [Salmonella enterica]|nr:hypothetical protein [Salmonella enterica]